MKEFIDSERARTTRVVLHYLKDRYVINNSGIKINTFNRYSHLNIYLIFFEKEKKAVLFSQDEGANFTPTLHDGIINDRSGNGCSFDNFEYNSFCYDPRTKKMYYKTDYRIYGGVKLRNGESFEDFKIYLKNGKYLKFASRDHYDRFMEYKRFSNTSIDRVDLNTKQFYGWYKNDFVYSESGTKLFKVIRFFSHVHSFSLEYFVDGVELDLDDDILLKDIQKLPEYKNKIQELTQNLAQANRDKQTLESQKSAIQSKLNRILNSAKAISPNVTEDTLNQYLRDLQNQKSTLEQEKATLENSVQSLTNEKQALERSLQSERESNNRNTLEITRLSSDLELNKRRIADLESQITNKNQEIERLNLRYETLNNSVMDLKSLLESKGIKNVGNTNLEVLETSKRELNRLLSNDLRLQQIQEELKILGINKTDTREVIEELNSRSKTLERIDKILSGESWLENTTDKVKLLEDIKRQVKEVLKQAKKENIPQVVEELKRLQEIEKKYNSLVKTLVGDDLTLNPQTRAEELVQKESEYEEIKQAFENKTKDEILNRIQELNSAESELKKIQNKAKTLNLDHTKIDKILEDLVKRKNQLENILKGLGGLGNIELTEENLKKIIADLIQQKKDLEQAKAEAQKLGLDITSIKDLISKLDKGNKDLQSLLEKNQKLLRDTENELRNKLSEISDLKRLVKSLQDELDKLKKKDLENTNKIQDLIANSDSIKTLNLLSDLNSLDGSFTRGEIAKVFYKHSNLVNKNIDESNLPDSFVRVNKFKDTDDFYIDFLRSKYITVGIGNEQFGANKELDNNMLGAFALRYNGIYDFDYKNSFNLAREKGLLSKDSYKNKLEIAEDIARWK